MHRLLPFLFGMVPLLAFGAPADCPDLTALQRIAGYASWLGFFQIIGIGAIVAGLSFIFWGVIKTILNMTGLMEALLWLITIGTLGSAYFGTDDWRTWTVPIGSLLVPCAFSLTAFLHNIKIEMSKSLLILTAIWAAIASYFDSSFVGFFAVGSLLGSLGFSILVTPFCHAFGFTDDDALARGTTAGLLLLALYLGFHVARVNIGTAKVFEAGVLWLASFVAFIGLLILSCRWYARAKHYGIMNAVTIAVLLSTTTVGTLYGVREVTTMAGAFIIFYLSEKVIEIETDSLVGVGVKLLVVGLLTGGAWMWLKANETLVTQYLAV